MTRLREIQVLRSDRDGVAIPGPGDVRALVWPGMGARHRSLHRVRLRPGASTDLWCHPGEAVYYVLAGSGWFDGGPEDGRRPVRPGLMVHVGAALPYLIVARDELVCIGGPCPPDPALYDPAGRADPPRRRAPAGPGVRVFDPSHEGVAVPLISRQARLVVWPGVGAQLASMNFVVLEPGEANVPHRHDGSEDTIFVVEGRGVVVDTDRGRAYPVEGGCVVHVPVGVGHVVEAETRMVSVGGPCPPDLEMLRS